MVFELLTTRRRSTDGVCGRPHDDRAVAEQAAIDQKVLMLRALTCDHAIDALSRGVEQRDGLFREMSLERRSGVISSVTRRIANEDAGCKACAPPISMMKTGDAGVHAV